MIHWLNKESDASEISFEIIIVSLASAQGN